MGDKAPQVQAGCPGTVRNGLSERRWMWDHQRCHSTSGAHRCRRAGAPCWRCSDNPSSSAGCRPGFPAIPWRRRPGRWSARLPALLPPPPLPHHIRYHHAMQDTEGKSGSSQSNRFNHGPRLLSKATSQFPKIHDTFNSTCATAFFKIISTQIKD